MREGYIHHGRNNREFLVPVSSDLKRDSNDEGRAGTGTGRI